MSCTAMQERSEGGAAADQLLLQQSNLKSRLLETPGGSGYRNTAHNE